MEYLKKIDQQTVFLTTKQIIHFVCFCCFHFFSKALDDEKKKLHEGQVVELWKRREDYLHNHQDSMKKNVCFLFFVFCFVFNPNIKFSRKFVISSQSLWTKI